NNKEIGAFLEFSDLDGVNERGNHCNVDAGGKEYERAGPDLLVEGKHHVPCHGHKYQCPGGEHKPGYRFVAVPVSADKLAGEVSDNHIYYCRQGAQQSLRIECDALAMIQMIFSKDDQVQLQRRVTCQAVRIIWIAECVHQYPISDERQDGEKIDKPF